ncbi:MAG: hypothetical protein CMM46_01710 [Rhodospirillaceae bacterium]|nr:hypothetical protein [Rhodospirillaceae bacterium]|tara:strand:- start:2781 stop:3419 length:639 start_codon:yes stop_codon:yes gene_type:complete
MIRHLVFDLDGTLVPSNDVKRSAFFECSDHVPEAAEIIAEMLDADPTRDRFRVFDDLVDRLPDCGNAADLVECYSLLCHARIVALLLAGETAALLDLLGARGLVLHLSSGTPRTALVAMMEETGLDRHFDSIYGAPGDKADRLMEIMQRHALQPLELAVVGDGDSDARAAEAVGAAFLRVADDASDLYGRPAGEAFTFLLERLSCASSGVAA